MRRLCGAVLGVWMVSLPIAADAQILVEDLTNLVPNTITSIQSFITAAQTVALAIDSVTNLTGYDDSGLDGLGGEFDELNGIITDANQILWNIQFLQSEIERLFGLDGAPDSTRGLRDRLYEVRRYQYAQLYEARRLQTLQYTTVDTVRRIVRLWDRLLDVLGAKQNGQLVSAQLTQLQYMAQKQAVLNAAYQQAMLSQAQEAPMIEESISRINDQILIGWPER